MNANRIERILAYMVASSIGLSLIAIFSVILAPVFGVTDYSVGAWPFLVILPPIGLTIGFLLIIALLVLSMVRRSREAKDARK